MLTDKKYYEGYRQQFVNMTPEQIENHIGLEKVRNVMDGLPKDHGIDNIREIIKKVKEEKVKQQTT